ncbi:hypothetical protein HLASF_0289 [Halanaeroarchaeum sulfurireducens]|uniref:Uncharacterized protein n=1 Tax=Halanaeroarchaeum sulfurireducens TaxID=1604004 RepID=A0A0F7P6K5_9EURY|nr:hypothetical protein HLASF_0289 [Halanaeroarchaeum sulfurireducens]ALG81198.1 hypothetical protein HLASA_0288 [Halanaeroarchaeum sulfurireducens]
MFQHSGRTAEADVEYDLVPSSDLEHITDFRGPQLSFEFAIPAFAEDALAKHITTAGVPWEQPRYDDPVADISEPNHRGALADRYDSISEPEPINTILASVTEAITADGAPENEGLTTNDLSVETVALLESDPGAVPTFRGIAIVRDVPEGEHRLTVNGAGVEPHSETLTVGPRDGGPTIAGVEGEIPLVARENATKLEVDPAGSDTDITDVAVEDDFAGRLYDAPIDGPDAVYVHRGGAYTTEVRDADGEIGAVRVNPSGDGRVRLEAPQTGKASLAKYLADVADETAAAVAAVGDGDDGEVGDESPMTGPGNAVRGLATALEAVGEAARRAAERAAEGKRGRADENLDAVRDQLERVQSQLIEASEGLPDDLERAIGHRLEQVNRRSEQALAATKL